MASWNSRPLPDGMRDLLPEEALANRRVESAISRVMESWGYVEVIPATIRFSREVSAGPGASMEARTYKFADRRGNMLTLRPDMTTPAAAMVAAGGWALPAKVYYTGNVFRIEGDRSGRPHEFLQAGAEVFGVAGSWADAEIVALCVECLKAAGASVFRIGIGNVSATRDLLERAGIRDESLSAALESLQKRDMVSFERVSLEAGVSSADVAALRDSLRPAPVEGIVDPFPGWKETLDALRAFGIEDSICVDMGIVRDMSYYTGMVFEVYGKGIGRAAGGGGRYDGLMARLGAPQPATGFALNVPEVVEMVRSQGSSIAVQPLTLVVAAAEAASQAGALVGSLRRRGLRVRFDRGAFSREEARRLGVALGASSVMYVTLSGYEEMPTGGRDAGGRGPGAEWFGWLAGPAGAAGIH